MNMRRCGFGLGLGLRLGGGVGWGGGDWDGNGNGRLLLWCPTFSVGALLALTGALYVIASYYSYSMSNFVRFFHNNSCEYWAFMHNEQGFFNFFSAPNG